MVRAILMAILAASLVASVALQSARPRDLDPAAHPAAPTPSGAAAADCGRVLPYQRSLFSIFSSHEDFMDYWNDPTAAIADMDDDELAAALEDGLEFVADLESLPPPEPYAEGHEGIVLRFAFEMEYLNFLAFDTSIAPGVNSQQESLVMIYNGEVAIAEACPDEVDAAGGYIFLDPDSLEDVINP